MSAIDDLVRGRFMLCEDADDVYARLLQAWLAAGMPAPKGNSSPQETVPACPARKVKVVARHAGELKAAWWRVLARHPHSRN